MLIIRTLLKWLVLAACGLLALFILLGVGGVQLPWPPTEVTQQKPYAAFVGREYRVISSVSAYAWNDYPDKAKIQSFSLLPPPGVRNRFVSYVTPLQPGQRVRIVSAWRHFVLFGFHRYIEQIRCYSVGEKPRDYRHDVELTRRIHRKMDCWRVAPAGAGRRNPLSMTRTALAS